MMTKTFNKTQMEMEKLTSTVAGSNELLDNIDYVDDSECRALLKYMLRNRATGLAWTPPSDWFLKGDEDPHYDLYNKERSHIACGGMTDDTIANALFMGGDSSMRGFSSISILTAGKERIRWLSRSLITVLKLLTVARGRLAKYENVNVTVPYTGDLDKFLETEYTRYIHKELYIESENKAIPFDSSIPVPESKK